MTNREKNKLVAQYEPLVNKLTKQFVDKVHAPWDDIKSYAYEGLAIAMNTYDADKSSMTFTQFAGFAIRNNILTSLNNELRTVKLSAYAQKKAIDSGEAVFNTVSIEGDWTPGNDNGYTGTLKTKEWMQLKTDAIFADGDIFETLYCTLEDNFSARDCEIFYMTFGLKDYDVIKGKDIAVHFNISKSSVSIKVNNIIEFIRKDNDLMEILSNLLK